MYLIGRYPLFHTTLLLLVANKYSCCE